ncbi:mechanosensitive ion channel family protein [Natronolimnohabitans innermongolicus]|uniref:Mechanosensitive ion channel MscS n=1 Tax=Natronolimnohabitans innermongolicus JCM 12255 TaxID=1227499 RepID=L9XKI8_9EURY|nr:mechanosensitive ion channel family protein [Natronolimnohabitans innermongolicus]ELY62299.1 mechanosensitive ion channel MscS [Natronolimnohabitans innermongolicus JCM 12255]
MRGLGQLNENEAVEDVRGLLPFDAAEFVIAIAVLLIGWYLSKVVVRLTGRTVARQIERPSVTRTVLRGVRISVLVISLIVALTILGVGDTQILLSVTVISAIIAVVLAPLVGSLINGFFVLSDRPYEIGDMIEVTDEGHKGFVEDITIRYTKIFTLQNTFIVIPNSEIHERDVINYSAEDERTRLSLDFEITYDSDLEVARRQAERAARNVDVVISGGPDIRIGSARYGAAPACVIDEYADDGIALTLLFWIKHPYKQAVARSAVQAAIHERYADADVEFAYPHRHHVFDDSSGVARVIAAASESDRTAAAADGDERAADADGDSDGDHAVGADTDVDDAADR